MEHCEDRNPVFAFDEENEIWKPVKNGPADGLENGWILVRRSCDRLKHGVDREEELVTEALDPFLVPPVGFGHLGLGLGPKD